MKRLFLIFSTIVALAAISAAHADDSQPCDDVTVAVVARWAGVARQGQIEPVAAACKMMPNTPGTTIAAIAFDANSEKTGEENGSKTQVIALLQGTKVVAADRSTIVEDSRTVVGSFRIDTAPYRLSPEVRAFGVVFTSDTSGSSCPDYAAESELTLWVREGSKLRPVFGTNLYGWASLEEASCRGSSESANMTVVVEKTVSHGFADLSLVAHIVQMKSTDGSFMEAGKHVVRTTLHYDGASYGIDMFRTFWYPASALK